MDKKTMIVNLCLLSLLFYKCSSPEKGSIFPAIRKDLKFNDETLVYKVYKDGVSIGLSKWKIKKKGSYYIITTSSKLIGLEDKSKVIINNRTLMPLESEKIISKEGFKVKVSAKYSEGYVELKADTPTRGKQEMNLSLPEQYMDNEQVLQTLRFFTFEKGKNYTLNILVSTTGMCIPVEIKLAGTEAVKINNKKYECNKIEMKINPQTVQYAWYYKKFPYFLVKYKNNDVIFKIYK